MIRPEAREPGPLARHDGEPVFDEPWQAQILALAFHLIEQGVFSNAEWSGALGEALAGARVRGDADDSQTYYRSALAALENLLAVDGRITADALAARTEAWRHAYLNTPHGQPVELAAGELRASGFAGTCRASTRGG